MIISTLQVVIRIFKPGTEALPGATGIKNRVMSLEQGNRKSCWTVPDKAKCMQRTWPSLPQALLFSDYRLCLLLLGSSWGEPLDPWVLKTASHLWECSHFSILRSILSSIKWAPLGCACYTGLGLNQVNELLWLQNLRRCPLSGSDLHLLDPETLLKYCTLGIRSGSA
jgi:hypothetical protein